MAIGASFFRAMSAGMLATIVVVPADTYRDMRTSSVYSSLPWTHVSMGQGFESPLYSNARETAFQALVFAQAADEYRRQAAPGAGAIVWSSTALDTAITDIGRVSCVVSSDNKTVCTVSPETGVQTGLVAASINNLFGNEIAGIFDGTDIVTSSGATISVPPGVTLQSDAIVLVRE